MKKNNIPSLPKETVSIPSLPKISEEKKTALKQYKNQRDRIAKIVKHTGSTLTPSLPTTSEVASLSTKNINKLTRQLRSYSAKNVRESGIFASSSVTMTRPQEDKTIYRTREEIESEKDEKEFQRALQKQREKEEEQRTHRKARLRREEKGYKNLIEAIENDALEDYLRDKDRKHRNRAKRHNREWEKKLEGTQLELADYLGWNEDKKKRRGRKKKSTTSTYDSDGIDGNEIINEEIARIEKERRIKDEEEKERLQDEEQREKWSAGNIVYHNLLHIIDSATMKNRASRLYNILDDEMSNYKQRALENMADASEELIQLANRLCFESETETEAKGDLMAITEILRGSIISDEESKAISDEAEDADDYINSGDYDEDNPFPFE